MPNQISIPFKKTYALPIKQSVYNYIESKHHDTHPEAFRWDIGRWESMRKSAISGIVHVDRIKDILSYHAQLVFILTKLPADIGLEIPYAPAFAPTALPVILNNLHYERCCLLFNLAALYSQIGASEDRSTSEGVKRASGYYQSAAGVLSFLAAMPVSKLQASLVDEALPSDLMEPFLKSLELLMLAQAQECAWQRAVIGQNSNGVIAKLAAQVSFLYGSALSTIRDGIPALRSVFPGDWLPYLETKHLHFDAAAQYRKGVDDIEHSRYGHELARLSSAQASAKRGYDIARRGRVPTAVQQDVKSILEIVESNLTRAQRDNDLIYHQDVPTLSALPAIQPVSMVQSIIPVGLQEPKNVLGNEAMIFAELLSWGARLAIDIYNDGKQSFVKEEILDRAQELTDARNQVLRDLNLPAALEALDKPIGLPPSLLTKAEEVRLDHGPDRIDRSVEDVQSLAKRAEGILSDAMDILDQEASEDEKLREELPPQHLPSHEANEALTSKAARYRGILDQAADSDRIVRERWENWEENIIQLTWDEATLESSVPSSTVSVANAGRSSTTQNHARALRVQLEQLDDLVRERDQLVNRAQRLADTDDIAPRILKAAAGLERWVEVHPSMFEDTLDEELSKYDKFRNDIRDGGARQEEILEGAKTRTNVFLQSRKDDPTIKEREHALQSLDLAYHQYKDITRHLDEGLQFYNDLATLLMRFKENCKEWVDMRRSEMQSLTRSVRSLSLKHDEDSAPQIPSPILPARAITPVTLASPSVARGTPRTQPARAQRQIALDLPPPDSDQWQTMDLPPPPTKGVPRKQGSRTKEPTLI